MTITEHITAVADFIKENNTYFDKYFPFAEQDEIIGVVNDGYERIFPSDEYGNYFYIRYPHTAQFDTSNSNVIADMAGSIGIKYDLVLVSCVRDADETLLLENLLSTLANYCKGNFRYTKANWGAGAILQELIKIPDSDRVNALQRLPENMQVVSISFTYTIPYVYKALRCIQNPCKNC